MSDNNRLSKKQRKELRDARRVKQNKRSVSAEYNEGKTDDRRKTENRSYRDRVR